MYRLKVLVTSIVIICGLVACGGADLEGEINNVSAELSRAESSVATQEAEFVDLESEIGELKNRISDMEAKDVEISDAMSSAEESISQLEEYSTEAITEIDTNSELLGSLEDRLEEQSQELADLRSQLTNPDTLAAQIPESFGEVEREALAAALIDGWNNEDWEGLYYSLSEIGRLGSSVEEAIELFPTYRSLCGEISDAVYSHYENFGKDRGADFFGVYYLVEYEKGGSGDLEITIRSLDGDWENVGFNFNCQIR